MGEGLTIVIFIFRGPRAASLAPFLFYFIQVYLIEIHLDISYLSRYAHKANTIFVLHKSLSPGILG